METLEVIRMKSIIKRLKSKTYIFAGLIGVVLPVVEANMPLIRQWLTENQIGVYLGISIGIGVLRELTNKPVSEK